MGGTQDQEALEPSRQAALRLLLSELPPSFAERHAALLRIRRAFHLEVARSLGPALNLHTAAQPQDSPEQRKALAVWINQQLRDLGLAVVDPATGMPAVLATDRLSALDPETTRFRFVVRGDDGKTSARASRKDLPKLQLTEHAPRIEPLAKYYRRKPPQGFDR